MNGPMFLWFVFLVLLIALMIVALVLLAWSRTRPGDDVKRSSDDGSEELAPWRASTRRTPSLTGTQGSARVGPTRCRRSSHQRHSTHCLPTGRSVALQMDC